MNETNAVGNITEEENLPGTMLSKKTSCLCQFLQSKRQSKRSVGKTLL